MAANTRFAVAVHVLGFMAYADDACNTSEQIARSVDTNPVVIRRLLASLREAELVASQPGPGGGWRLTRPVERISLSDVYQALGHEPLFALPERDSQGWCDDDVGAHVMTVLDRLNAEAADALHQHLAKTSVADVVVEIARQVGPCPVGYISVGSQREGEDAS